MDVTGLADPYVKIYLLYNGQRIAKKKTHVKKRTLSPVFNESFVFDIPAGGEALASLEFLLLDWDRVTKNEVNKLSFKAFNSSVSAYQTYILYEYLWRARKNFQNRCAQLLHLLRSVGTSNGNSYVLLK